MARSLLCVFYLSFSILLGLQHPLVDCAAQFRPARKKIVVFISTGGGGHVSAGNAIKEYLKDSYDVTIVNVLDEVLGSFDPVKFITFGSYNGEDFYNYLITNNLIWIANSLASVGAWNIRFRHDALVNRVYDYLGEHAYDLVISVVPFVNGAVLEAVQKRKIPFIIVPTDLNGYTFVQGIEHPEYEQLHYVASFDDTDVMTKIREARIPEKEVAIGGFPLRPDFFAKKDIAAIKRQFAIPVHKKVVMVLMGAAGSKACFKYIRRLMKNTTSMHIIACIGRNEQTRERIASLYVPKHISLSVIGFTPKIADLMAVSDLIITKPGSVSFCEALYTQVPVLLDSIYGVLSVESFNLEFVKKYDFGDVITSFKEINPLVTRYLTDTAYSEKKRHNLSHFRKHKFGPHIQDLVERMLHA